MGGVMLPPSLLWHGDMMFRHEPVQATCEGWRSKGDEGVGDPAGCRQLFQPGLLRDFLEAER